MAVNDIKSWACGSDSEEDFQVCLASDPLNLYDDGLSCSDF